MGAKDYGKALLIAYERQRGMRPGWVALLIVGRFKGVTKQPLCLTVVSKTKL